MLATGSLLASAVPSRSANVGSAATARSDEPGERDRRRAALDGARPAVPHAFAGPSVRAPADVESVDGEADEAEQGGQQA